MGRRRGAGGVPARSAQPDVYHRDHDEYGREHDDGAKHQAFHTPARTVGTLGLAEESCAGTSYLEEYDGDQHDCDADLDEL